jgi:uncharacterized 2Fe-2S/4Fe-4S cluster protein (DUF4445 family)
MTDHLVLFMPSGKRGRFPTDTPVLDAARQLGVHVESVCGGRGICGRCQVDVQEGVFAKHGITSSNEHISPFGGNEVRYAEKRDLKAGRRLSCSAKILGDLVIDIPQDAVVNAQVVRKDSDGRVIERNPAIHMCYVEVEEPDMHKPLGDLDRLLMAIEADWGFKGLAIDAYLYGQVQQVLRKGDWKVTAAVHEPVDGGPATLIALYPGLKNEAYGIACDIGSTTIAMHLSSLLSGRTLASSGTSNPQIRFGEDLMSRVSYVMMNPEGREGMTVAVREAINGLIDKVCKEGEIERGDVLDAVFVGNPIMHHLFLGIDPTELGGAPFALAVSGAVNVKSSEIDIPLNPGARVYMLPCIAGHVGADAAAATLTEGPHRQDEMMLLVDVGTNAEIVLGNSARTVAASSPTGPAFEGAEISCGQRAAPGAIERIRIDPETLEPRYRVIGIEPWSDEPSFDEAAKKVGVTGVCGSGIIEIIAEMYLAGIITEDGVINGDLAARSPADHRQRPHLLLPAARRRAAADGDPDRCPRHPTGQGCALCRRQAVDGQAGHRSCRPHRACRRLRLLHRSQIRPRPRPRSRLRSGEGQGGRQRRGHRRPHGAAQPQPPPRDRTDRDPYREDRNRAGIEIPGAFRQRHGFSQQGRRLPAADGVVKLPERSMDTDAADGIEPGAGRRRGGRRNRG